jgi:dolichol kinase
VASVAALSGHALPAGIRASRVPRRIFICALTYTGMLTAIWLLLLGTGMDGGSLFGGYAPDVPTLSRIAVFTSVFMLLYGWLWYRFRRLLLRRAAAFSESELDSVFASRMDRPFDLGAILAGHSERRIRIIDMVGRRGRSLTLASIYTGYVYLRIASGSEPRFLTAALADGLLDAIVMSWFYVAAFYSNGFLGRVIYGAPSRIMDGSLARANLLSIVTLWSAFKFVMVPLGTKLAPLFPHRHYAALFGFIWISYQVADTMAEVVGCAIGKQRIPAWGIGEVNRKSVAGTFACFSGSLVACLALLWANDLPVAWLGLALMISVSNTFFELFSPRGTDDFTMATANGLLCWAFGILSS